MDIGFGLIADPVRKRPWGHRQVRPSAVADALLAEARDLIPEAAPLLRSETGEYGTVALQIFPIAGEIRIAPAAGSRITVIADTGGLGPGYHAWLIDALARIATAQGFTWHEDSDPASRLHDRGGYFQNRDAAQLRFRFREQMTVAMNRLLTAWGEVPALHCFGLPDGLRPARAETGVQTLRGPRRRVFAELARTGGDTEAEALFPWWEVAESGGISRQTAVALAEALLWTCFPWRAPLEPAERMAGEAARALLNRAGPGETGDMPVDELETLLAATNDTEPRPDGPGYLRGQVARDLPGGWSVDLPGYFRPIEPDENQIRGWWFGGREVHLLTSGDVPSRRDTGEALFDPGALLDATDNEIAFVEHDAFYSGQIAMHEGPGGRSPELTGAVQAATGMARLWVLFRGAGDSPWVLESFRSLTPPEAKA